MKWAKDTGLYLSAQRYAKRKQNVLVLMNDNFPFCLSFPCIIFHAFIQPRLRFSIIPLYCKYSPFVSR